MTHNKWTEEEKEFVRANYKVMSDEELHNHLPSHSVDSIATWRRKNNCHYDNPFGKKYTFRDIIDYMNRYGYELISDESEFKNALSKIRYRCNIHNDTIQTTTIAHLAEGKKCRLCGIQASADKRKVSLEKYIDKDKARCVELNFEYIDTIRGKNESGENKIFIKFICNNHRNVGVQKMPRYNMYRDIKGCEYCAHKKFSEGELELRCSQGSPHIKIITKPILQVNQRVDCVCDKHGFLTNVRVRDIIDGTSCAKCGLDKLSEQGFLTDEEVCYIVSENHPNAMIVSEYQGVKTPITLRCNKCGFEYSAYIHVKKQCPNCENYYYGERMVQSYLEENNISYIPQYKFDDCRNKRALPFDFYLPHLNVCIEYQGKQHYTPIDIFGGEDGFQRRIRNDEIKREYCHNNNITLIEIPYTCNTVNAVEEFINKYIKQQV